MYIADIRKAKGLTQSDLAHMIKVEQGYVSRVEKGFEGTTLRQFKSIAKALDVPLHMLMGSGTSSHLPSPTHQTSAQIPRYDARLSAGHGAMNTEHAEILDYIPFTNEFVTHKLGRSNVDGLICCYVLGESMVPTLADGDLVIIDTNMTDLRAGLYALNYGDESYVKRVEKHAQWYALASDNQSYQRITVAGEDLNQLHIIGKVIWSGGVR